MIDINEPFEKVTEVHFVGSKFGKLIKNFEKWFPQAEWLSLANVPRMEFRKRLILEKHMPALKRFDIRNMEESHFLEQHAEKVNNYNISTFIKLNPQLEHLVLTFDQHRKNQIMFDGIQMDNELLKTIDFKLPCLKYLYIRLNSDSLTTKMPELYFNELPDLNILFIDSAILDECSISTGKINKLQLKGNYLRPNIFKFIECHANVKNLQLRGEWYPYDLQSHLQLQARFVEYVPKIIQLAPKLPFLNELHISYQIPFFQPGQMLTLLESSEVLRKLVIHAANVKPERKDYVRIDP